MSTWLITGCSSGLGHHLARTVLESGHNVIVTARDPEKIQDLIADYPETGLACALDVTDQDQIAQCVQAAESRFGGVDVLVNNAGYGYRAAVEEAEDDDIVALFDANFFGAVSMIRAVLPAMRSRRTGTVVNVSSIAARKTAPGSGYYSATKCALEGMSRGLRAEVEPLGMHVIVVEPGAFRTDFAGRSLKQSKTQIDDYADTVGPRRIGNDKTDGYQPGDPARAGKAIMQAVNADKPPRMLALGSDALGVVGDALDADRAELNAWAHLSRSTDFPD